MKPLTPGSHFSSPLAMRIYSKHSRKSGPLKLTKKNHSLHLQCSPSPNSIPKLCFPSALNYPLSFPVHKPLWAIIGQLYKQLNQAIKISPRSTMLLKLAPASPKLVLITAGGCTHTLCFSAPELPPSQSLWRHVHGPPSHV